MFSMKPNKGPMDVWDPNEDVEQEWGREAKHEEAGDAVIDENLDKQDFAETHISAETFKPQPEVGTEGIEERQHWDKPPIDSFPGGSLSQNVGRSVSITRQAIAVGFGSKESLVEDAQYSRRVPRPPVRLRRDGYPEMQKPEPGDVTTTNVGFGQTLRRMIREAWGAAKPEGRASLKSPIAKVRFTQTGTRSCSSTTECMQACRDLQQYYMDLGFPDIPYNFLIGGDGVVYHGRGWGKQADRSPAFHKLKKSCLDVAYIGSFVDKKIPFEMLSAATDFLKYGLKVSRLTPFFQTFTYLHDSTRS